MRVSKNLAISLVVSLAMLHLGLVSAEGATASRVTGERPFFKDVKEIEDVLSTYGRGNSQESETNPANVSFHGDAWLEGAVYFSLRGLKGWDLQNSAVGAFPRCNTMPDPDCEKIMRTRGYMATLPPCQSAAQSDCISRLAVTSRDGFIEDATPIKKLGRAIQDMSQPGDPKGFQADAQVNLPAGGEKWLWSFQEYRHSSGPLFIPSVSLWQQVDIQSVDDPYRYPDPNVWISLSPVSARPSLSTSGIRIHSAPDFELHRETFLNADSFMVDFRTSAPWTTWNKASLGDLSIAFKRSGKDYTYSVRGRPSLIPEVGKNIPVTKENLEELKGLAGGNFRCSSGSNEPNKCSGVIYVGGKGGIGDWAFDQLERIEKLIDKDSESLTYFWLMQTSIEVPYSPEVRQCSETVKRIQPAGTVSSNATLQQDGPPIWDPREQAFTYRVGALSKLPSGEDFEGTYTFQLSTEMAKCIWGKIPTAKSLTIQVINSDRTVQLVTTSATTLGETFVFNASGFHFSSPRIMVKDQGLSSPVATPKKTPTSMSDQNPVICVKGRKIKKLIQASRPKVKCPTGWKRA